MLLFNLSLSTLVLRFYLLTGLVIVAGFSGIWSLAFLALPVFLTCLLGMRFSWKTMKEQVPVAEIGRRLHLISGSDMQSAA